MESSLSRAHSSSHKTVKKTSGTTPQTKAPYPGRASASCTPTGRAGTEQEAPTRSPREGTAEHTGGPGPGGGAGGKQSSNYMRHNRDSGPVTTRKKTLGDGTRREQQL